MRSWREQTAVIVGALFMACLFPRTAHAVVPPDFIFNIGSEQLIYCRDIYRDWNKFLIYTSEHAVFIEIPLGKAVYIFPDIFIISMKEMSSIFGDEYAVFIVIVIAVASDMVSFFQYNNFLSNSGVSFRKNCPRNSSSYNND
jgi:hypothetical protein